MTFDLRDWGTVEGERDLTFPCDDMVGGEPELLFRAVGIQAPPNRVWPWLCQLKLAPYSYDWLDNFGRRSPRELIPGADELEVGQPLMKAFELASWERDVHLTGRTRSGRGTALFGDVAVSYLLVPNEGGCRLVFKGVVDSPRDPIRSGMARWILPAADLAMMRKQLHTFRDLAEAGEAGRA